MNKRDFIGELIGKRVRHQSGSSRINLFSIRIDALREALVHVLRDIESKPSAPVAPEFLRYFPTGIVASIEGYFRIAIADLINLGDPFRERAADFKDVKFSVYSVRALVDRKITLGEVVAHMIPLGSLNEINKALSTLLKEDFFDHLKCSQFTDIFVKGETLDFQEWIDPVFSLLSVLYSDRHVYCHELAPDHKVNQSDVARSLVAAEFFVACSEVILWHLETEHSKLKAN